MRLVVMIFCSHVSRDVYVEPSACPGTVCYKLFLFPLPTLLCESWFVELLHVAFYSCTFSWLEFN